MKTCKDHVSWTFHSSQSTSTQSIRCMLCLVLSHSLQAHGLQPIRLLCWWDFPGKNTEVGCHALFQGIFLIQGSNPRILRHLHCRQILYCWATWEALQSATSTANLDVWPIHYMVSLWTHHCSGKLTYVCPLTAPVWGMTLRTNFTGNTFLVFQVCTLYVRRSETQYWAFAVYLSIYLVWFILSSYEIPHT